MSIKKLRSRLLAATSRIIQRQSESGYEAKMKRIIEEVASRASEYLGNLEHAQSYVILKLSNIRYIG